MLTKYHIKSFHGSVFFSRQVITNPKSNPYLKWPDAKARAFLGELLMAIRRRNLYPVGCAVEIRDFESYSWAERWVLAGYQNAVIRRKLHENPAPYHVAFRVLLEDAVVGTSPDTELHFVLAEQDEFQQQAHDAYRTWKRLTPGSSQGKSLGFESPGDQPRLQAADLLVRQWYNTLSRGQRRLNRENVLAMEQLTSRRNEMLVCDAAGIERIFSKVGVSDADRERLRQERPS
ncbi:MAG: hypothetical protein Q7T33_12530 [Dehalococcoidia bacterium]|nr:hypothetical protein [Dehalococcoidia bacterium]